MSIFEKIQELCKEKGINPSRLENELGFGRGTLYTWRKSSPSIEKLQKVADYFEVPVDRFTGESASSIIKSKLEEKGMTLEELAEKSKVSLDFLRRLDDIVPDQEYDGGEECYSHMSAIAWVLGIPGSKLRLALARQEVPAYDGPTSTPEKDFFVKEESTYYTCAAHKEDGYDDDLTEDEQAAVKAFIEAYRKSKK